MPRGNRSRNDWTIMFFFASDNDLSPLNVSQIKGVKDAGYQKKTEVLLYFDSNEKGVPTRLFNVNYKRKGNPPRTKIGDGRDPYVRNCIEDELLPDDMDPRKGPCTAYLCGELSKPDSMNATEALENFIGYCHENNPARRYILIVVGHGMVVANDTFLFDEYPRSGIGLTNFGKILRKFKERVIREGATFELLGLHSCSMSAVEVAYELRETANYMIASEGFSYVGSWPYRQLLKKIFNTTEQGLTAASVQSLIRRVYELSLYNATDFAFSGYSHDLTLCSLDEQKLAEFIDPFRKLTENLKRSLDSKRGLELILLAHLKSQSFWRDEYTDIYDFCRCLNENCDRQDPCQRSLSDDCRAVMDVLNLKADPFDGLIVFSDNFGWEFQYSHGLSVYFPWTRPLGYLEGGPLKAYKRYAFTRAMGRDSWLSFLEDYWTKTMRPAENQVPSPFFEKLMSSPHSSIFGSLGNKPGGVYDKPGPRYNKPGGGYADSACVCPSIKNYPTTIRLNRRVREMSMTRKVEEAFR
jgi:hypothetical protein